MGLWLYAMPGAWDKLDSRSPLKFFLTVAGVTLGINDATLLVGLLSLGVTKSNFDLLPSEETSGDGEIYRTTLSYLSIR